MSALSCGGGEAALCGTRDLSSIWFVETAAVSAPSPSGAAASSPGREKRTRLPDLVALVVTPDLLRGWDRIDLGPPFALLRRGGGVGDGERNLLKDLMETVMSGVGRLDCLVSGVDGAVPEEWAMGMGREGKKGSVSSPGPCFSIRGKGGASLSGEHGDVGRLEWEDEKEAVAAAVAFTSAQGFWLRDKLGLPASLASSSRRLFVSASTNGSSGSGMSVGIRFCVSLAQGLCAATADLG